MATPETAISKSQASYPKALSNCSKALAVGFQVSRVTS